MTLPSWEDDPRNWVAREVLPPTGDRSTRSLLGLLHKVLSLQFRRIHDESNMLCRVVPAHRVAWLTSPVPVGDPQADGNPDVFNAVGTTLAAAQVGDADEAPVK